jgi:hypothetical protein
LVGSDLLPGVHDLGVADFSTAPEATFGQILGSVGEHEVSAFRRIVLLTVSGDRLGICAHLSRRCS